MSELMKFILPLFSLVLMLSSCKPEPKEGNFTLQLTTTYGNEAFSTGSEVIDDSGRRLKIDKLKFYLSHITLVKTDNSEVEIKDVALLDAASAGTLKLNFKNIEGDFKQIKFGIGIDSLQNETDPLSVPESSPLSNDKGMYWSWLKYQFIVLEGKCDSAAGGTGLLPVGLIYHMGSNPLYRTAQLSKNFSLCCGNEFSLNLNLDVKKIFYGSAGVIDVATENTSQTTDHADVALKFTDNFAGAFQLQ